MNERQTLGDVMTPEPIVLDADATIADAARAMRARNVGDVLVRLDVSAVCVTSQVSIPSAENTVESRGMRIARDPISCP